MNKSDTARATRLIEVLAGRPPKEVESQLMDATASFADFRVRLVTDSKVLPAAPSILSLWKSRIERIVDKPDVNELMHAIELLTGKQEEIERKLRERDLELLERLRDLDRLTESLAELRREARMIRRLIASYRQAIINLLGNADETARETANAG